MLNRWTYGWFGPPASNQTQAVQKSQHQSQPLRTSQLGRSSQQLDQQHVRPTTRAEQSESGELKGNAVDENSQTSADSFKTAPDGYGTTLASGHHQVRFEAAPTSRPLLSSRRETPKTSPHTPYRPPLPAPTISSNTMNRLKAQLSSRTLPPKSPPLQSIPHQPKNENREELYDIWPSPQPQNLPPPPHNFHDRNVTDTVRYGGAGMSRDAEVRERHRVCTEEWQDNGELHPHTNDLHPNRKDPYLSDPSSHFPPQLDHSRFDPTHSQVDPIHPHFNPSYSQQEYELYHPLEFDGQPQFFDHRDSPSFPFHAHAPSVPSYDLHPPPSERPSSIVSEATLHEASHSSPNHPISTPHQLSSTIPFSYNSRHMLGTHGAKKPDSDRHLEEHWRTVEEEVRKRIELERRPGGFGKYEKVLDDTGRRISLGQEELERVRRSSKKPTLSSKSTSSIGFFPELPSQPEMLLFEGVLLVPPPNFTSLAEIAKLHRSHWTPYHAILTTRTLHFLVNSDPSTQTPILVLDFDHCKSLNKPPELRDWEKLFSFGVEMENGKKRYFACKSGRDWLTWTNKIRELIDLAHGRAPPTLETALDSNSAASPLNPAAITQTLSASQSKPPTFAYSPRSMQIKRHLEDLEEISKLLDQGAQSHNARDGTSGRQRQKIGPKRVREHQETKEDWMKRFNEDLQVRAFMDADPNNSRRDEWRPSQPPYPPASPAPPLPQDPPRRLRKPRPRSRSFGITPEELDLARSIFEDLSERNAAADGEVYETHWRVDSAGKRIDELRDSIEARIGKGKENELAKDWIDRLGYLSGAINDTRLKAHRRNAVVDQIGIDPSPFQPQVALRILQDELEDILYARAENKFDEKRWSRNNEKTDLASPIQSPSRVRRVADHLEKSSRAPHPSPQELLHLFQEQQHHLEESRRFQQDQSRALASLVRDLHANQNILSDQLPQVQQALSTLNTVHNVSNDLNPATNETAGHNQRTPSNAVPLSNTLPLESPRKGYHLVPNDGRIADRAIPPSQIHAWRQGEELDRGGHGKKEGVRIWGVPEPLSSAYHQSRLKGGLEAARAAKEIVQFDTIQQELAPPPPYEANTITSRRSTLQSKQKTNHDDEVFKRELAEELRKGFEGKAGFDPATQAFAVYEALSKLAEKRNKKGATEKQ